MQLNTTTLYSLTAKLDMSFRSILQNFIPSERNSPSHADQYYKIACNATEIRYIMQINPTKLQSLTAKFALSGRSILQNRVQCERNPPCHADQYYKFAFSVSEIRPVMHINTTKLYS